MKLCNHCGAVLEDYALFCNNCGISTKDAYSQVDETPVSTHENPFETPAYAEVNLFDTQPLPQNFAVENTGYIPQPQQTNYNPYTYNQTPQPKAPRIPIKERVQGIVGMILSISSVVLNATYLELILALSIISVMDNSAEDILFFAMIFTFYEIIFTAPAVVGLALGTTAKRNGNYSKMPIVAKVLGLTSIFIMVFSLVITFFATFMFA